jgi:signal peptidase I
MEPNVQTSDETPAAAEDRPAEKRDGGLFRFIITLVLIAWAIRSFVFSAFYIPTGSMVPTLYIGDYLFVAKWPYGYSRHSFPLAIPSFDGRLLSSLPERGDVVVFHHPVEDADLIKRVIGLPGDTIEVRQGQLVLNGAAVPKRAIGDARVRVSPNSPCRRVAAEGPVMDEESGNCAYPAFIETLPGGPSYTVLDQAEQFPGDDFAPVTVPAGSIFVMGDNRDDSMDSRFQPAEGGVGFLPMENLIGRATITFWSTDGGASYWKPWTWFSALRGKRIGNSYTGGPE